MIVATETTDTGPCALCVCVGGFHSSLTNSDCKKTLYDWYSKQMYVFATKMLDSQQ